MKSKRKRFHGLKGPSPLPSVLLLLVCLCGQFAGSVFLQAAEELDIDRYRQGERVPIHLGGFESTTLGALKFDLEIQGFESATKEEAVLSLTGSQRGNEVRVRLADAQGGGGVFYRGYAGTAGRDQAHTIADDVVQAVFGNPGISKTMIAFRGKTAGVWEIYVSDYDGYDASQVTRDRSHVAAPTWIPGNLGLYYTSYKVGSPNIVSHDLRSGSRKRITRNSGLNTSAALSPDGSRIAMILSKSGSPDLYVARKDGSGEIRLTRSKEEEACPTWSQDGQKLCFTSSARGGVRLYTIAASGGTPKRLSTGSVSGMITEPDWSPDGKWIAFTSRTGGVGYICVVPAAGGQAEVLTQGEDPCWAPNSRNLVFMREKKGRKTLSLLDVPTKHVKDVFQTAAEQSQPSWAR